MLDDESLDDALDRRAALAAAVEIALATGNTNPGHLIAEANYAYAWLRHRDTLRAASVSLVPFLKGSSTVATSFSTADNAPVNWAIAGQDEKGAELPAPPADTWAWTLADPDNSGAALAPSGDTLSAVLTPGTPTANLVVSIAGQTTGLQASCTVDVTAGPPVAVELVPSN